jgi:hypothetical protein
MAGAPRDELYMVNRPRIVIASPHSLECETLADWLVAEGFEPIRRQSARATAGDIQTRAFDLLIVDAAFAFRDGLHAANRSRNPQTPTIVVGDAPMGGPCGAAGSQVMFLERPVDRAMLVCTVSMAILDARPTRRSVRKAVRRLDAVVNGTPSFIVDISPEGLRLEIPRRRRAVVLPPQFSVRVPMIGVSLLVQRMWARSSPGDGRQGVMWCGGALAANVPRAERAWLALVDAVPAAGAPTSLLSVG